VNRVALSIFRRLWSLLLTLGSPVDSVLFRWVESKAYGVDSSELDDVEVWRDQSGNGNDLTPTLDPSLPSMDFDELPDLTPFVTKGPYPVIFDESEGAYRFADGTVDEGRPCRTCHKPTKPDEVGFCEPCAFAELRERRGA
jgi:hypothetical protein